MKKTLMIIAVIALLTACSGNKKRQKAINEINKLNKEFDESVTGQNFDLNKAHQLVELYSNFVEEYPKDSVAPEMMIKQAILQASYLGETKLAVSLLESISEKYPKSVQAVQSLFLAGDYYQYKIKDLTAARKCYQKMIDKYPKDPLTSQARILMQNLGKSPEELLDMILDKAASENSTSGIEK